MAWYVYFYKIGLCTCKIRQSELGNSGDANEDSLVPLDWFPLE